MSDVSFNISENRAGQLQSDPESSTVTTASTNLEFFLIGQAAIDYRIYGYRSDDKNAQLGLAVMNKDGTQMTILDVNNCACTIAISVQVEHRKNLTQHSVDPQVTNEPP
jgi:hypothetical protein